jgi:hypothetical protein
MAMKAFLKRLWDDTLEWEATIKHHMYHDSFELQGEVPETLMISQTADILALAEIGFFDWVWWYDQPASFPADEKRKIGRYLGPSHNHGSEMCLKNLKANGNTRHTATFVALTDDDMQDTEVQKLQEVFNRTLCEALGPGIEKGDYPEDETPEYEPYQDNEIENDGLLGDVSDRDNFEHDIYDHYLTAEVLLPVQGSMKTGFVRERALDSDGKPIGTRNKHPLLLDTRKNVVQFPDGMEQIYSANLLVENMIAQCDGEGNQFILLDGIVDHKFEENAISKEEGYFYHNDR